MVQKSQVFFNKSQIVSTLFLWSIVSVTMLFVANSIAAPIFKQAIHAINPTTTELTITLVQKAPDSILADSVQFHLDSKVMHLEATRLVPTKNNHEMVYNIMVTHPVLAHDEKGMLLTVYQTAATNTLQKHFYTFTVPAAVKPALPVLTAQAHVPDEPLALDVGVTTQSEEQQPLVVPDNMSWWQKAIAWVNGVVSTVASKLSSMLTVLDFFINHTNSWPLRSLAVFLLGLLLSLTPCIYPMIPVTMGILQTNVTRSIGHSALLALTYTCGIATTFALLGLLAAFGGTHLGQFMGHPIFIAFIVMLFIYLAFSLFDFYELPVPHIGGSTKRGGGFLSAFLFGALSGPIASPCLSPGLILVLTMVAGLGSKIAGFGLLFLFGIGSSFPLLIVGTFSNALTLLPRSGSWMVEVKKIFGFMLLGMSVYYARVLLPLYLTNILLALILLSASLYYLRKVAKPGHHVTAALLSIIALTATIMMVFNAYKAQVSSKEPLRLFNIGHMNWETDYKVALEHAKADKKLMLVKFGASWCSLCQILEDMLKGQDLEPVLQKVILVAIDCSKPDASTCVPLLDQFNVKGFPTVLLIDPLDQKAVKTWHSELTHMNTAELMHTFQESFTVSLI
jgi:thiol:disulfide interchange protein DsbD